MRARRARRSGRGVEKLHAISGVILWEATREDLAAMFLQGTFGWREAKDIYIVQ